MRACCVIRVNWTAALVFQVVVFMAVSAQSFFDVNTYEPASTYDEGFQVEHGRVLPSLAPAFGAMVQIDDDPLLSKQLDPELGDDTPVIERLVAIHLSAAMGLFEHTQLAVHLPLYIDTGQGTDSGGGVGDLRLSPKVAYRFAIKGHEVGVGFLLPLTIPTGNELNYIGDGTVGLGPRIVADTTLWKIRLALNFGFYLRSEETNEYNVTRGSEMHMGLGAIYPVSVKNGALDVLLEVVGNTQLKDAFSQDTAPFNVLGGMRYTFESGVAVGTGVGFGVTSGIGAPDVRVLFGLGWTGSSLSPASRRGTQNLGAVVEDRDLDGIPDAKDSCLDAAEDFDQWEDADGCPEDDNDGDGLDDLSDKCPNEAETFDGVEDEDGCPDTDVDGDGVPEYRDKCKGAKEDLDGFQDTDGCPDEDNDNDTVPDVTDRCPNLPETFNQTEDEDGCPDYFKIENNVIVFPTQIRFVWRAHEVEVADFVMLEEVLAAMLVHPEWKKLRVEVHAFGGGKDDDQLQLTQGRADQILRFFIASGIAEDRMTAEGMGNKRTLAPPTTPQNKKLNQRVEIHIVEGGE